MHLKVSIVLFASLVIIYVKAETCPPESLTRPCECLPEHNLTLECKNITDASVLDGITRRTGDLTFEKFRLLDSTIESLPPNALIKKQYKTIEMYNSEVESLFDGVDESNNIRSLILSNVVFNEKFPWSQLKPLKNLLLFEVVQGFIPELGDEFKNNVNKKLNFLSLSQTLTRWISDGVFSEYEDLMKITIDSCGLRALRREYFRRPAAKLIQIKLDGNEIHDIPEDIFEEMPELQFVSLKGNKLTMIPDTIFIPLDQELGFFNAEKNPLTCDCGIRWLVYLSYVQKHGVSGKCYLGFEELKGKQLEELKSEDFYSSCHLPLEILNDG